MEANIHFSKVWRPAERVESQWTLTLLPLRRSLLLLQVSTGQIQAAVNLKKTKPQKHCFTFVHGYKSKVMFYTQMFKNTHCKHKVF